MVGLDSGTIHNTAGPYSTGQNDKSAVYLTRDKTFVK